MNIKDKFKMVEMLLKEISIELSVVGMKDAGFVYARKKISEKDESQSACCIIAAADVNFINQVALRLSEDNKGKLRVKIKNEN